MTDFEREQRRLEERARTLEKLLPDKVHRWDHRCRCAACGVTVDMYRRHQWPCAYAIAGTDPIEALKPAPTASVR